MPSGVWPRRPLRERVLSRLVIDPSGCLLWTALLDRQGYARVQGGGRNQLVHRLMYEWFVGPIPEGLQIDHLCRVRHCAAPAHLEAVTGAENSRRTIGFHGGPRTRRASLKTHCPAGHPYEDTRECRPCNTAAKARSRARKKAK